jgi:hypothetical protein
MAPAVAVRKLDINAIGPNQLAVVPALAGIRYPVSGGGATVPHFTAGGYWVPADAGTTTVVVLSTWTATRRILRFNWRSYNALKVPHG